MERELWPRLYHLVMDVGETLRWVNVTFQPHVVPLVFFWAALHDRPVCWACKRRKWSTTTLRPASLPSRATMSRRLRRVDTGMRSYRFALRLLKDTIRVRGGRLCIGGDLDGQEDLTSNWLTCKLWVCR